jgi:hypothetical protein
LYRAARKKYGQPHRPIAHLRRAPFPLSSCTRIDFFHKQPAHPCGHHSNRIFAAAAWLAHFQKERTMLLIIILIILIFGTGFGGYRMGPGLGYYGGGGLSLILTIVLILLLLKVI